MWLVTTLEIIIIIQIRKKDPIVAFGKFSR